MSDDEMQISEAELRAMTAEMVEMHEATFPQMYENLSDLGSALREDSSGTARIADRRRFLLGGGALAAGGLLLATTGGRAAAATLDRSASAVPAGTGRHALPEGVTSEYAATANKDVAKLKLDASLENLAVFAYGAALKDAGKGKFGKVPAAVAEFAKHAMRQHADHTQAFNAALANAGSKAYTKPDPALTPAVLKMYKGIHSVTGLAKLALTLENTAAATYIAQMKTLRGAQALSAVATIAPVERQHAAILSFVLGDYPVPDVFVKLGPTSTSLGARSTSDLR